MTEVLFLKPMLDSILNDGKPVLHGLVTNSKYLIGSAVAQW